jgi:hypothetical protein
LIIENAHQTRPAIYLGLLIKMLASLVARQNFPASDTTDATVNNRR